MEDSIATTLSEAVSWIASETMSAIDSLPTDQVDLPLEPPIGGDEMGPDSSEGSYFLVRPVSLKVFGDINDYDMLKNRTH